MKGWRKEDCGSRVQRESSICRSPHSGEAISIMVGACFPNHYKFSLSNTEEHMSGWTFVLRETERFLNVEVIIHQP